MPFTECILYVIYFLYINAFFVLHITHPEYIMNPILQNKQVMCQESQQLVNKISFFFHLPLKLTPLYHPNIWTQVPKLEGEE